MNVRSGKLPKQRPKPRLGHFPHQVRSFKYGRLILFGELPTTNSGHKYVLTAVCMFSKYLVCIPLQNKDTLYVAEAFLRLISTYGCPSTVISDKGTEFLSTAMAEVCRSLNIPQQFTHSITHLCLGACEQTHTTHAQSLTPYMNTKL